MVNILSEVENSKDRFSIYKKYFPIFSAYAVCVSALYLWGFWTSFNVNILQYIDIPGIVKTAIFPLLIAASSLVFGVTLGHLLRPDQNSEARVNVIHNSRISKIIRKKWRGIFFFWVFFIFLVWFFGNKNKWEPLSVMVSIPMCVFLLGKNIADDVFPDRGVRVTAIFLITVLLPFSYVSGLREAEKIKNGVNYLYVISIVDFEGPKGPIVPNGCIRYIGQVAEFGFFYNPLNESISVSKLRPGDFLSFKHYETPRKNVFESLKAAWSKLRE